MFLKSISATSYSNYETCPLKWKYKYKDKCLTMPNPAFMIGTAVHSALEKFHKGISQEVIYEDLKEELLNGKITTPEEIKRFGMARNMIGAYIRNPINLSISSNCNINRGCEFFTAFQNYKNGSIELEENVTLSPNVKIYAIAQDPHSKSFNTITKPVLIKKNVWICADVTILPGVTIGENAVIASKSIVNKSVNANEIWGGNPAKYIKKRNNSIKI